ncbi:Hypothetical protein PHPALM_16993 [Phytophthora palmivora]|uniref:Fucosyltransferase n=1 Tax=Phytophthora palmivora TaxID=4796 RepID=A0A2P4XND5_9STRA|nr:Hypothetical protein PHPALM_16993 [Phytophthora palmivora]
MRGIVLFSWLLWGLCSVFSSSRSSCLHGDEVVDCDSVHSIRDPITSFRLIYPTDGAIETNPIEFRTEVSVDSIEEYKNQYGDKLLCIELQGHLQRTKCSQLIRPRVVFDSLPSGNYTTRAILTSTDGNIQYYVTSDTTFTVVSKETLAVLMKRKIREEQNLIEWAGQRRVGSYGGEDVIGSPVNHSTSTSSDILLVIGVKTAVVENFSFRQAIRETWASPDSVPHDVKVFFVGCVPTLTNELNAGKRQQIQEAIELEKQTYGDLLTDELRCEDSYDNLPTKVKEFLRFASQTFPHTPFVMIADDDIYLRVDRLADELRKERRTQQLYIGQVWDTLLGRSQEPVRERTERYYISKSSYPLHTYPPFAFGPHYILSMDCARFIASNSDRLRGLGAMDDVSVALWLLTKQVHVEHTLAFSNLRIATCTNGLLSLADLSPFGIRSIHANLVTKRDFCFGFDEVGWQKIMKGLEFTEQSLPYPLEIQTYVHNLEDTEYLYVTSIISTKDNAGVKVSYYPSAETFCAYSRRVCLEAHLVLGSSNFKSWTCHGITQKLRAQVQQQFRIIEATGLISLAFLELWKYNLFVAEESAPPFIVAYTTESSYASVVFECIFKIIFEGHKRPVLVVPEKVLRVNYRNEPDVFIFSIFDSNCDPMSNPGCHEMIEHYMDEYLLPTGNGKATKVMMISGEAIDTRQLDDRVPLLSSVSDVKRTWHVYLPIHTPVELLSLVPASLSSFKERRFCAYLYARCDRSLREYMFDLLNAMEPVDALGICAGSSRPPDNSYRASRYFKWFNDEANYKFVIAFENSAEPGYVTEKLLNPFLAGSIPIYWGNSTTVSHLFNPDSFIDCGRFEKLEDCAAFVLQVHKSPELYLQMRREPPIRNLTAFNEAFSWHPSVSTRSLADKVARMLHLDIVS